MDLFIYCQPEQANMDMQLFCMSINNLVTFILDFLTNIYKWSKRFRKKVILKAKGYINSIQIWFFVVDFFNTCTTYNLGAATEYKKVQAKLGFGIDDSWLSNKQICLIRQKYS